MSQGNTLTHYKPEYNTDGTEKHISLDGARYHVLWWDAQGAHCSEKNCEVNKREPFSYWHQGESIEESDFHLFADMPNSDEDCAQCRPLFTRPPSTSQRELEMQTKIAEADKQEPVGYQVTLIDPDDPEFRSVSLAEHKSIHTDCINTPLFTRPPIISERELELLAVIEQMREKLESFIAFQRHVACGTSRIGTLSSETHACLMDVCDNLETIIAIPPDISALREHDARVLEDAADKFTSRQLLSQGYGTTISASIAMDIRRMASELRRPKGSVVVR